VDGVEPQVQSIRMARGWRDIRNTEYTNKCPTSGGKETVCHSDFSEEYEVQLSAVTMT
jgi:hypothetical protein